MQCLAVLIIVPSVISDGFWNSTQAPKNSKRFDATVQIYYKDIWYCQGVILNSRYVLTDRNCFNDGNNEQRNVYIKVGNFIFGERKIKASNVHFIVSLSLIQTELPIKFNDEVRCIDLPTGWEFPLGIPNYVRFDSSNWCRETPAEPWVLFYKWGITTCTHGEISSIPEWYIPVCLIEKTPNCYWASGAPLVYNNTLVGIRNYRGEKAPAPYSDFKGELYINVARHVKEINEIMVNYETCTV